ncbi:MAG: hypothetical protein HY867_09845 [Chloroflexi bacterium]|nr:hypothetical protein [Chloroflexota bacterium]
MSQLHFNKILIACLALVLVATACFQGVRFTDTAQSNATPVPLNLITQDVQVVENPLSGTRLDCPVMDGVNALTAWAKLDYSRVQYINIIQSDSHGRMWLATDGRGLTMFDGKEWHNWQPETREDMSYDALRTMAVSEKYVYVGAYGSSDGGNLLIYDIEKDKWQTIEPSLQALSGNVIGGLAISPDGEVFMATGNSINIYNGASWRYIQLSDRPGFLMFMVEDALFDHEGNYWLATSTGLWRYDGKSWTTFTAQKGELPSNSVNALALDSKNRIWAATVNGLSVYDGTWHTFSVEKYPWFKGWLLDVEIDSQDRVWIVDRDEITVFNGKEIAVFTPNLVSDPMWGETIGFDQLGCAWIDGFSGLAILREEVAIDPGVYEFK